MKYVVLIMGLWVVGCSKQEQTVNNQSAPTTTGKPVKELTLREKVIGTYELKENGDTYRWVFLSNGSMEDYINGEKEESTFTWKLVDGQIHHTNGDKHEPWSITEINPDGSLTLVAHLSEKGERRDIPRWGVFTWKKIK